MKNINDALESAMLLSRSADSPPPLFKGGKENGAAAVRNAYFGDPRKKNKPRRGLRGAVG